MRCEELRSEAVTGLQPVAFASDVELAALFVKNNDDRRNRSGALYASLGQFRRDDPKRSNLD